MSIYAIDWHTKKEIPIYDGKKIKKIPNSPFSIAEWAKGLEKRKHIFLFEAGGGDFMKILLHRQGHTVLTMPGIHTKQFRDRIDVEKTDDTDVSLIYELYTKWVEETVGRASSGTTVRSSSHPLSFYPFSELDCTISSLRLFVRRRDLVQEERIRENNRALIFNLTYSLTNTPKKEIDKVQELQKTRVEDYKKEEASLTKQVNRMLGTLPIWTDKWKKIKGFGPNIVGGLIAELGRCQAQTRAQVRMFTSMVPREANLTESGKRRRNSNRIRGLLYDAVEQIIKQKTPGWNEWYYRLKEKYASLHPDWSKGKVDNYARRVLKTQLAIEFWSDLRHYGMLPNSGGVSVTNKLTVSKLRVSSSASSSLSSTEAQV